MLDYLIPPSPSFASLTGGYAHLAPTGAKTNFTLNQINDIAFNQIER